MKKIIIFCFTTLFFLVISFASVNAKECEIDECENNINETITATSYEVNNLSSSYDIMTYDRNGNVHTYSNNEIAYKDRDNIELEIYDYSMRNDQEVDYDGRNINLRDEPEDEDDPYEMYYSLPYSAICLIYSSFDTNEDGIADVTYISSGTMISTNKVLTSCEYTFSDSYGLPINLTVIPGAYTNENEVLVKPFGQATFISVTMGAYHYTCDEGDNWAIIELDWNIGSNSGYFLYSDRVNNDTSLSVFGSVCMYDEYWITRFSCTASNVQEKTFRINANCHPHMTGGPLVKEVYYSENESYYVVCGIQTSSRVSVNNITYSNVCKVTSNIKNFIQGNGVLEFRIFADTADNLGHSWLTIKNNSTYEVEIGKMLISGGSSVSIGTWPGITMDHSGIYYNYEYYLSSQSSFTDHAAYKKIIFIEDWNTYNYCVNSRDSWTFDNNCTTFAIDIWNTMLPRYSFYRPMICTPANLKSQIEALTGYENNMAINGSELVGYFNGETFVSIVE